MRKSKAGDAVLNTVGELERELPTEVALIVDSDERDLEREFLIEGEDDRTNCSQFYLMNAIRQMAFNEPKHRLLLAFPRADREETLTTISRYYFENSSKGYSRFGEEVARMLQFFP